MVLYRNALKATFIKRINRYLVEISLNRKKVLAHCPNPGRLLEIFLPHRELWVVRSDDPRRKTEYTIVAAGYRNLVVPLYSLQANRIAEKLIIPELLPKAKIIRREVCILRPEDEQHGPKGRNRRESSRIDFLMDNQGEYVYMEVKACTLVEQNIAMFPDAPTKRGLKHLMHLDELCGKKGKAAVLFVIMRPDAHVFIPNVHTDLPFSQKLLQVSNKISLFAASIQSDCDGRIRLYDPDVKIDLELARILSADTGTYMLLLHIARPLPLSIGSLGLFNVKKGYFIYIGSAMRSLSSRIRRHLSKSKKIRWHIDYLTPHAACITAFPIRSRIRLECALAEEVRKISTDAIKKFGSSDCACSSHLYYFPEDPRNNPVFIDLLFRFRHRKALGLEGVCLS